MKLNSLAGRERLGSTAKFPRWAAAFKYPPEIKETVLQDIVVQVGRTGVLTPRAIVAPVHLAGTTVTAATLHNQDFITDKDIRIGDTVRIRKAGEIIPEILEVVPAKRPADAVPYRLPDRCPVCGAPVVRDEDGAALRCTGAECPAQLSRNLAHFVSREAMNIDGLGSAIIDLLIEEKMVSNPADLYALDYAAFAKLPGQGKKSAANLKAAIEASKQNDLARLLCALGIRQVGSKAAKVLASTFGSLDALQHASLEDLTAVPDIGETTAQNILDYFASPQSQDLIDRLRAAGVNFMSTNQVTDTRFAGKTFVLTGALSLFTREEATEKTRTPRAADCWWTISVMRWQMKSHAIIFIDDFHLLTDKRASLFLCMLANRLPANVHLIVASRELNHTELSIYAHRCGTDLTDAQVETLLHASEGWFSAVYLNLRTLSERGVLPSRHSDIYTFSAAMIDPLSPEPQRAFLAVMGLADEFTVEMAQYITGDGDAGQILSALTEQNAFVTRLQDGVTYRFHHMMKECAERNFQAMPAETQQRYWERFGLWYEQHRQYLHALAAYRKGGRL